MPKAPTPEIPTERSARKPARLRKKLLAASVSCLVALFVLEFSARLQFGAPVAERLPLMRMQSHPTRGWQMVPNENHYTYLESVEINALGLRGPEVTPKQVGERRVLVLGDSLTYGQGVGESETLPYFLEERLNRTASEMGSWVAINAGHRAYDTRQEIALLEELGPKIEPDIVVLNWYWNDLIESDIEGQSKYLASHGTLTFDIHAKMEGSAKRKWEFRQVVRKSALAMALYDIFLNSDARLKLPDPIEPSLVTTGHLLDRFATLASEMRFIPVVAILPDPLSIQVPDHFLTKLGLQVEQLASERSLFVIAPLERLKEKCRNLDRLPTVPYDGHYNGLGNKILGYGIADAMLPMLRALESR